MEGAGPITCLTYCALPYNGNGWPQTCVGVLEEFRSAGIRPVLVTPRLRKPVAPAIDVQEGLRWPLSRLPWSLVAETASRRLERDFASLLASCDAARTIAYFWPDSPVPLVELARARGIITVREMINCQLRTSKEILDKAYREAGLEALQPIPQHAVDAELAELKLYDYIVAPAPMVEASLIDCGIAPERILAESYGWSPQRFPVRATVEAREGTRFLFVGTLCVRKGIPQLLRAWEQSRLAGELVLVGDVEPALAGLVEAAVGSGTVRHVRYTDDVGQFYSSADAFVFPTLEEGCPQVTMEAAGCGLPIITTRMGAGRLIRHGSNGMIVDGTDVAELSGAMKTVAGDVSLRRRLSDQVAMDALQFTYERVSARRAATFLGIVTATRPKALALSTGFADLTAAVERIS